VQQDAQLIAARGMLYIFGCVSAPILEIALRITSAAGITSLQGKKESFWRFQEDFAGNPQDNQGGIPAFSQG